MKLSHLFLLLLPLLSFGQKEGQERIDSLLTELLRHKTDSLKVKTLNDLSFSYQYINPTLGEKYGHEALNTALKIGWNDGIAEAYRSIGINYSIDSDFEKSLFYYEKALKATSNKKILSKVLRSIGLIYTYQSDYKNAMDYDMRALKMSEDVGDKKGIAAVLSNIGIVYFDLHNFSKAIEYYDQARKINESMGNIYYLASNLGNLASSYAALKQNDKAIAYYKKAIAINDKLGDISNKAINISGMADLYFDQEKYAEALQYTNESLRLSLEINDDRNMAHSYGVLGDICLEQANMPENISIRRELLLKAKKNLYQSLLLNIKLSRLKDISTDYQQLGDTEALLGNYKEAYELFRKGVIYKDSVFNADSKETIKNLEDKRTIELKQKEIQLNKITLENKEKQKWYFIGGILLLTTIGSLLYYQSRNRRKTNEKLQLLNSELDSANKTKMRFFSILNHDLRSPVSNLVHFLHLKKENPELLNEENKIRLENKTITGAENLLTSMEDLLLWSKGQMEHFAPQPKRLFVRKIFEDTAKHFSSEEEVAISFENSKNVELVSDENYIKTIIRNLTGNAIKALENTKNPTITWKAWSENKTAFLSVTDNGPGINQQQFKALYDDKEVIGIKSGLGLHLIRDLAKAIDCEISVDSKPNEGTTFVLKFNT
ncbi:Sensor protein TorS [compost metagenome]